MIITLEFDVVSKNQFPYLPKAYWDYLMYNKSANFCDYTIVDVQMLTHLNDQY